MLPDFLHDRAALYVSGAMPAPEREAFEILVEFHGELRAQVIALQEALTRVMQAQVPAAGSPPPALKARLLAAVEVAAAAPVPDAFVVTDPAGLIEWVNPAFTAMCGYDLAEVRGRKPAQFLQGPATDPVAVSRIRACVREHHDCRETLVNYHRDGSTYRVDVRIAPILDDAREPVWFVARERKLAEVAAG